MIRISVLLAAAGLIVVCGCSMETIGGQATYVSPEAAVDALSQAADSRDRDQLRKVFGPRVRELSSGDREQDDEDLQRLSAALQRGYRFEDTDDGEKNLLIGPDSWPFAVPLLQENGRWRFDTDEGIETLTDRRVGKNELDTIATCHYYVASQELYRQMNPEHSPVPAYAARIASSAGKRDGLYWPAKEGETESPMGPLVSSAVEKGDLKQPGTVPRQAYRGYFYKVLTRQGPSAPGGPMDYINADGKMMSGFALLAWPAEYDRSGVKSFMVAKDGVVFEADLGADTPQKAESITAFDPDSKWSRVQESATTAPAKTSSK